MRSGPSSPIMRKAAYSKYFEKLLLPAEYVLMFHRNAAAGCLLRPGFGRLTPGCLLSSLPERPKKRVPAPKVYGLSGKTGFPETEDAEAISFPCIAASSANPCTGTTKPHSTMAAVKNNCFILFFHLDGQLLRSNLKMAGFYKPDMQISLVEGLIKIEFSLLGWMV